MEKGNEKVELVNINTLRQEYAKDSKALRNGKISADVLKQQANMFGKFINSIKAEVEHNKQAKITTPSEFVTGKAHQ